MRFFLPLLLGLVLLSCGDDDPLDDSYRAVFRKKIANDTIPLGIVLGSSRLTYANKLQELTRQGKVSQNLLFEMDCECLSHWDSAHIYDMAVGKNERGEIKIYRFALCANFMKDSLNEFFLTGMGSASTEYDVLNFLTDKYGWR